MINEFYVSSDHRSQGVGEMLLDAEKNLENEKNRARVDVTAPTEKKWVRTVQLTGPKLKFKL
ncbi:MAG: GNAT family N-acetyltransferase [Calditrichia bacterium]